MLPAFSLLAALALGLSWAGRAAWAAGALNVLLITADDLGPMLSSYGETRIATPRLDELARSGVQFQVAWAAQASCSPSRSAILTGLYPHSTGQYGLTSTGLALHPELRDKTLPAVLEAAGYRTGIIGKLHVAPEESFPFDQRHTDGAETRHVRRVAELARGFLAERGDAPFFLMVNFADPHAVASADGSRWAFPRQVDGLPEHPLPADAATPFGFQGVDDPRQRERTAGYLNAVQRLDAGVGMLLDALARAGRAGDTLVIFVGDHGPPFQRAKATAYEAGLRIPFLVRWPGVSTPHPSQALVSVVDIAPTIYDAAGLQPPVASHGSSLRPVLGSGEARWRSHLAAEFHMHGPGSYYPRRAIRDQRFKLIHNLREGRARRVVAIDGDIAYRLSRKPRYDGTPVRRAFDTFADPPELELYDLRDDPFELDNRAGAPALAAVQAELGAALLEWREQTRDPFLDPAFAASLPRQLRGPPERASRTRKP